MAKTISSLNVILGATVKPFLSAFAGVRNTLGGFKGAAEAAGGSLLRFTGVGAAVALGMKGLEFALHAPTEAIAAAKRQIDAETKLAAVLNATGYAAGFSADQLKGYASELQSATTFGDESIIDFQAILATFRNVAGDTFKDATRLGLDMAAVMGQDLKTTAVQLGKALNDPTEGLTALKRVGVSFTEQQVAQIKAMQSAGNMAGAQAVILKELQNEFGGTAAAMAKTPFGRLAQLGNLFGDAMEQVGKILADVIGVFSSTFDLTGVVNKTIATLARIGPFITGTVAAYLPVFIKGWRAMYAAVAWTFDAIMAYVSPVMSAIAGFIRDNWRTALSATVGLLTAAYSYISSTFGAAWSLISESASGIVIAWNWAMKMLGVKTADTGSTVGNIFQGIVDVGNWFMDGISTIFTAVSYAVTNWRDLIGLACVEVALAIVRVGNEIVYIFKDVIGGALVWMYENWQQIFLTIGNFTAAVFTNMLSNAKNFGSALWSAIKGDDFNFDWTPLTEGFQSALTSLPVIADREKGDLEKSLESVADTLKGKLGDGLGKALADQHKQTKDIAKGITDGIGGAINGLPKIVMPELEIPPIPKTTLQVDADTSGVTDAAKNAKDQLDMLTTGSAESQLAKYKGMFDGTTLNVAGQTSTAPTLTADPRLKLAPLPSSTTSAMRDGKSDLLKPTNKIADLAIQGNVLLRDLVKYAKNPPIAQANL